MITLIFIAVLSCFVVHEAGHHFMALYFGSRIKFRFAWGWLFGKIPIPRYIWYMPVLLSRKQRLIAVSGFGAEIIFALFVWAVYSPVFIIIALIHLFLYKFYAGEDSDFKWL